MRKINRDSLPPVDLYQNEPNKKISKWRVAESIVIKAFRNNPIPFKNGEFIFPKNPSYDKWKQILKDTQGKKCCFCEKSVQNGVIEHFRPKKGWQQNSGDPLIRPGYYWLAYRWRNLLLSCTECNESGQKGNLFPIDGTRALIPMSKLQDEKAKLINPYEEEPSNFITYFKSEPVSLHPRGRLTIDILKLKVRADIKEIRKDKYDLYSVALELLKYEHLNIFSKNKIDEAKERIRLKIRPKEPFSGMILENLKNKTFE